MDQARGLRQTMRRFGSEMDRLRAGSFVNLPAALTHLLDALDSEPVISGHLAECVAAVPDAFDAAAEVDRVAASQDEVFGPFPGEVCAARGEAYLLLQELLARRVKFHDPLFMGYVAEPAPPRERFAAFEADVIARLIDGVTEHLAALAAEAGIELGPDGTPADEPAAPVAAPAVGGFSEERLEALLVEMDACVRALPEQDREDATLQLEALRDELTAAHPKQSVVRVLLRVLGAIGGDERYAATLEELGSCLESAERSRTPRH